MKASVKFRENQSSLWKAKLPLLAAGVPLLSGLTVGDSQDLALHLGTFFEAGPSCKIAYKPNDPVSPLSLVLKMGFGLWGSPNAAALAMTAEFHLTGQGFPSFSVSVKPRIGDFSLRKHVKSFSNKPQQVDLEIAESRTALLECYAGVPDDASHLSFNKASTYIPISDGNVLSDFHKRGVLMGTCSGTYARFYAEGSQGLASASNEAVRSLKVERSDKEKQGRSRELEANLRSPLSESGVIVDVPDDILQEENKQECRIDEVLKSGEQVAAAQCLKKEKSFRGWGVNAHNSLLLGKKARLNIQWGVEVPHDLFGGPDNIITSFSVSKLPFLVMDKISIERINPQTEKSQQDLSLSRHMTGSFDRELLPISDESSELARFAAIGCSMKQQLHLLYMENKILWGVMEKLRAKHECPGEFLNLLRSEFITQDNSKSSPPLLEQPQKKNESELIRRDGEGKKNRRHGSRRDACVEVNTLSPKKPVSPVLGYQSEVSEELQKAVMSMPSSPTGGKSE